MALKAVKVTNTGGVGFHTVVGGTRSNPEAETVRPGETKTIKLDVEAPHVKAAVAAGLLTIGGEEEVVKEAGRRSGAVPSSDASKS